MYKMSAKPYYHCVNNTIQIVSTPEQQKIIEWATNQADRYNCTSIPSWARMPVDNYEEAKREYNERNKSKNFGR